MKTVTGAVAKSFKAVGNTLDKVNPIRLFRMSDKAKFVIVMIRHAESEWDEKDLFCGWYDAELTKKGKEEAAYAGKILKESGFKFNEAHTSVLKRCNDTLEIILKEVEQTDIPVARTWRLNERHFGCLTGLPKSKAGEKYTEEQVQIWRRSFDVAPPPMEKDHPYYKQIVEDPRYYTEPKKNDFPMTESLKLTIGRTLPYWNDTIVPKMKEGKLLLIVGHTNSLRAIIKHLDNLSDGVIMSLHVPTGIPFVYELDGYLKPVVSMKFLGDDITVQRAMDLVAAAQAKSGNKTDSEAAAAAASS